MEIFGKRWQLRLLAGLLAIFVTLYFTADLFGGIRADDTPTIGESSEVDEDTVDDEEEEIAEEDEPMLFALDETDSEQSMLDTPFEITKVEVTINDVPLQENGTMAVKNGDKFSLKFEWEMTDGQPHKYEIFSYDLNDHLQGVNLKDTTPPGEPVDYTGDGIPDAYYEVNSNVLTLRIGNTKNYKNYKGGFKITGVIDMNGVPKDSDGKFTIQFGDKTFDLVDLSSKSYLDVNKQAAGKVFSDGGKYWQKFEITVTNSSDTIAQNVKLEDKSGTLFTGNIRKLTINNDSTGSSFPLSLGNIAAHDNVAVAYEIELDPAKMLGGDDNYNSAWSSADNSSYSSTGWACADYSVPSFQKGGQLSADGKTITWTITVKPGYLYDADWQVTDRGQTWKKSDAGWTENPDGTYTRTLTTNAPQADPYVYTSEKNTAEFSVPGGPSKEFSGSVPIPPYDTTDYISKSHNNVTVNGDEVRVPWVIRVRIPDTDVSSVVITDELENAWQYQNQPDRIENLLKDTFKIIDSNNKTYTLSDPVYSWEKYTVAGAGVMYGHWADNVGFQLEINDKNFLTQNKGKDIWIYYTLDIKEAEISTVKNTAKMDATLSDGTELPTRDDSDTYRRNITVTKAQDYSGPASKYPRHAHSWKVTLTNNAGGTSTSDIVFKDTLPQGYELCADSVRLTDASGKAIPTKAVTPTADGFTVTVDASYSSQKSLILYYTAQMTEECYAEVSATADEATFTYTNKIEVTTSNGKGAAKDTFSVYTTNSPILSKELISNPSVSAGEFTARYRIDINQEQKNDLVTPIKVTDTLGSAMELVGSPEIKKLTGTDPSNSRHWTTVTDSITFKNNSGVLTFEGLQNETYYRIEYRVKGKALYGNELTANLPEVKEELKKRFSNTVELEAGDKVSKNSSIMLSDNYYRQSAYISFSLSLQGTKLWENTPAGTKNPEEVKIQLKRTETKINGTQDYQTYIFTLKKGEIVADGNSEFKPRVQWNGADWSFDIDNLTLRDATIGSDYTYQLSEVGVTGYDTSYQYKTSNMTDWAPVADSSVGVNSGAILQSDKSGEIDVKIINTYTSNKPVVSTLYIDKKDMTGTEQLADAQLTIRNTDGTNLSGVTVTGTKTPVTPSGTAFSFTTTNQRVTIKGLPEGNYELEETVAPSGYTVTTKFYFTIDKNGNVTKTNGKNNGTVNSLTGSTITLKDQAIKLTIRKTDKATGSLLPGAEFTLMATSPSADLTNAPIDIVGATFVPEAITKNSFTFITRANDVTIEGIPAGPYTLEEKKAPNRYKKSGTGKISFTISPNGTITGYPNNTITVQNELITADLTVEKVDTAGNALSGAAFTIKADSAVDWKRVTFGSDPGSGNGTSYKFPVNNGNLVIKGLPTGKYTLTETKAPSGYLQTQSFNFEVTSTGAITSTDARYVSANKITLIDKQANSGTIEIIKVDRDDGTLLDGAEFELTRVDDDVISYQTEAGTVTSSAGGKLLTLTAQNGEARISGLAAGEYIIKETKAPSGYILSAAPQNVTLISNGTGVSSESISIENGATEISINKVDMTAGGKQLEGAKLTITGKDNQDLTGVTVTGADSVTPNGSTISFTTTGETATIKGLPEGNYELEETVAPSGYIVTTKFYFTIDKDGNVTKTNGKDNGTVNSLTGNEITLKDKPTEIFIKKVDMTNSDQLPGATLLIQGKRGADFSNVKVSGAISSRVDKINSRVTLVTGNEDAKVQGLPAGDYELTETVAPTGYEKTTTKFSFKIGTDGKAAINTAAAGGSDITLNGNTITVKDAPEKENPDNPDDPVKPTDPTDPTNPGKPSGNTPGGNNPGSSNPSGTTKPAGGSPAASTTTTVQGAETTTTNRVTVTEPDELEPEKTTKQTTSKVSGTTAPDAAVTTTAPDGAAATTTTTTTAPNGTVTTDDEPGSGIDSNQTAKDDNPHTAVPFTSLAAVFVAAGTLAVVTQKKKNK